MKETRFQKARNELEVELRNNIAKNLELFINENKGSGSTDFASKACRGEGATLMHALKGGPAPIGGCKGFALSDFGSESCHVGRHIIDDSAVHELVRHARALEEIAREVIFIFDQKNVQI